MSFSANPPAPAGLAVWGYTRKTAADATGLLRWFSLDFGVRVRSQAARAGTFPAKSPSTRTMPFPAEALLAGFGKRLAPLA
ncbi:MAG: hypothetical protein LBG87_01315 [Spirochaetaceae bacterium]|jgi:hypothetical protein|nr:hypothetical protein [Spirochaetaceae bacterium]